MTSLATYWRTIRHLKARQIAGRVVFLLGARVPVARPIPAARVCAGEWILPARRGQSVFQGWRFRFLNEDHYLDDVGWDDPEVDRLWRYNLHYFDDLNAFGAEGRKELHARLLSRWIEENPPGRGTAWEPYPTSLRVVNWLKWLQGSIPIPVESAWIASMAQQVRWLTRRIEWHLMGNHLFANAKALYMAGLFFEGTEADCWRREGGAILKRELAEQVLADGGHFERSPMYHRLAFEDVLDLLACLRRFGVPDRAADELQDLLLASAAPMWAWTSLMRFSDGHMPRFNDSAENIAPDFAELSRVAAALGVSGPPLAAGPLAILPDSGYARLSWSDARAFVDVAAIGPDYLPGHAHADTLSFELEIAGRPVVVNRGTSCYGVSPRRTYERSTAAHSTVEVMNRSSSETWGGFRVGRRAYPVGLKLEESAISCAHDGYTFLPGKPVHRRTWTQSHCQLAVADEVSGKAPATARYHLAPGVRAQMIAPDRWSICSDEGEIAQVQVIVGEARRVGAEHGAEFGRLVPAETLEISLIKGRASTCWNWQR